VELAPFNINVNAICPGPFLTEMNISIADSEEVKKSIVGATALGRWAKLQEIQGAAIFLASDAASYMVGSMVTVDGGGPPDRFGSFPQIALLREALRWAGADLADSLIPFFWVNQGANRS